MQLSHKYVQVELAVQNLENFRTEAVILSNVVHTALLLYRIKKAVPLRWGIILLKRYMVIFH